MPVTKQAEKKMRRDKGATQRNLLKRKAMRDIVKAVRKNPTPAKLTKAYTLLDKAAKIHLIHKNKAARLKSKLSKLLVKRS